MVELGSTVFSVYRFYDAADTLLYVGQTYRMENRLGQHRKEKAWWRLISRIELDHFETAEEMAAVEARYIAELQPLYNIMLRVPSPPSKWELKIPERAKKDPEPWLGADEVGEALDWEPGEIRLAVNAGCPMATIANKPCFRWSAVQAWLEERDEVSR